MFVIMVYDVNAKRVAKVLKISRRYLVHVQRSVFEGEITPARLGALKNELEGAIDGGKDSILFYGWNYGRYSFREAIGAECPGCEGANFV